MPPQVLNFGALRVGETVKRQVKVVCKSKVPTPFSLANLDLSRLHISVIPRAQLELKPKEVRTIEFTFAPTQRLRPFTQDAYVEIAGIPRPLLSVSGAGQGIELHLDTKTVSFGPVVQGTSVTKRILLFNTGDVGVKFQWDHRKLEPDFSISPAEGFVQVRVWGGVWCRPLAGRSCQRLERPGDHGFGMFHAFPWHCRKAPSAAF